jgi:hypothetical protein
LLGPNNITRMDFSLRAGEMETLKENAHGYYPDLEEYEALEKYVMEFREENSFGQTRAAVAALGDQVRRF